MRIYDTKIDDYSLDPALKALEISERITVLLIVPDIDQLTRQIGRKGSDPHWLKLWMKSGERSVRSLLRRVPSIYPKIIRFAERHKKLQTRYRDPGFLDEAYLRWETFVSHRCVSRLTGPILILKPARTGGPGFQWSSKTPVS
jgi:hypothetical protein